jgi:hypothetical protein
MKFKRDINDCVRKSQELYNDKNDDVLCSYCHKMMKKDETDVVYNIEGNFNDYYHKECFDIAYPCNEGPIVPKEE